MDISTQVILEHLDRKIKIHEKLLADDCYSSELVLIELRGLKFYIERMQEFELENQYKEARQKRDFLNDFAA